jgi:hypothetical protein
LGKLKLEQKDYLYARDYFLDALDLAPNNPEAKAGINEVRKVIDSNLFQADQALVFCQLSELLTREIINY